MKTLTVYTQPNCQPCKAVKRWLDNRAVPYATVDITQSPEALDFVTAQLGYKAAPVVVLAQPNGDSEGYFSFTGFNPGELEKVQDALTPAA